MKTLHALRSRIDASLLLVAIAMLLTACAQLPSNYNSEDSGNDLYTIEHPTPIQADLSNHPHYRAIHTNYWQWLITNNVSADRVDLLLLDASENIRQAVDIENGAIPEMQLPDWYAPGGAVPAKVLAVAQQLDDSPLHNPIPKNFRRPSVHIATYLGMLHLKRSCSDDHLDNHHAQLTLSEYRYLHRFFLQEKIWTRDDFDIAEATVLKMANDPFSAQRACAN